MAPAYLSQHVTELPPQARVLEAVQDVARIARIGNQEISASSLAERFGFAANRQWTPVGDLSGGERRRLQLLRLLMAEPNVLVLDEPTNDLDIDTLTALEDLLDTFPGTVLVVSHDRYFVDRVCDKVVALLGDGSLAELPGGVEEYLRAPGGRRCAADHRGRRARRAPVGAPSTGAPAVSAADARAAKKEAARLERRMLKLDADEKKLHEQLAAAAADYAKAAELDAQLKARARGEGAGRGGVAGRLGARRGLTARRLHLSSRTVLGPACAVDARAGPGWSASPRSRRRRVAPGR